MSINGLTANFDSRNGGAVSFGDDSKMYVFFKTVAEIDPVKSNEMSREIRRDVPYVHIQQPAERDYQFRPATELDKRRFSRQWQAFLDSAPQEMEGTPLAVLFPTNPSIVENLRFMKIFTVEQLAGLSDSQLQNVGMGARDWMNKAKSFLEKSEKGKGFHELEKRLEQLELKIQEKDQRIEILQAALSSTDEEHVPKKRGRKPKKTGEIQ